MVSWVCVLGRGVFGASVRCTHKHTLSGCSLQQKPLSYLQVRPASAGGLKAEPRTLATSQHQPRPPHPHPGSPFSGREENIQVPAAVSGWGHTKAGPSSPILAPPLCPALVPKPPTSRREPSCPRLRERSAYSVPSWQPVLASSLSLSGCHLEPRS